MNNFSFVFPRFLLSACTFCGCHSIVVAVNFGISHYALLRFLPLAAVAASRYVCSGWFFLSSLLLIWLIALRLARSPGSGGRQCEASGVVGKGGQKDENDPLGPLQLPHCHFGTSLHPTLICTRTHIIHLCAVCWAYVGGARRTND